MTNDVTGATLFILDDHPAIRKGLKTIFESSGRYTVVGLASSASEARAGLLALEAAGTATSILVADNNLKGQSGIDFIREISRAKTGVACVVISVSIRFDSIVEALSSGAVGYIGKDQDETAMLRVLDAVSRGELGIEGEVLSVLANNAVRLASARMGLERSRYDALTPREKEVFRMVVRNKALSDIASEAGLSVKTIENLKSAVFSKLAVSDRFELYRYALKIGLVEEE